MAWFAAEFLRLFFCCELAVDHLLAKETSEFGHRDHMQVEHKLNALHRSLAIRIEEEHTRVVDEDIHHEVVVLAILEQLLRCILLGEIGIKSSSLYAILSCEVSSHFLLFLLLVANQ